MSAEKKDNRKRLWEKWVKERKVGEDDEKEDGGKTEQGDENGRKR